MPSARYLASKGQRVKPKVATTKVFMRAVPHMPLIPRCQAEVEDRQCKNEATRAVNGQKVFCGQHFKGWTDA